MKVFISHKQEDGETAGQILQKIRQSGAEAYLDLLEGELLLKGEKLTQHLKEKLRDCTDLLAVVSGITQISWWVPFEIGMAAEKDFPIVSYLKTGVVLPEYLSYWPKLKNLDDVSKYVKVKKSIDQEVILERSYGHTWNFAAKGSSTNWFYAKLKAELI